MKAQAINRIRLSGPSDPVDITLSPLFNPRAINDLAVFLPWNKKVGIS